MPVFGVVGAFCLVLNTNVNSGDTVTIVDDGGDGLADESGDTLVLVGDTANDTQP